MIYRSNRSLQPVSKLGQHIIEQLHYYRDCANILQLVREKQWIKVSTMSISVYPDNTMKLAKAHTAFNDVRQHLRGLAGVRRTHSTEIAVIYETLSSNYIPELYME